MDSTATGRPRVCILWRGGVSCPVSAAWHFCVAAHWSKYHCYKQAPSWYDLRCFKATLNPNKQTNKQKPLYANFHAFLTKCTPISHICPTTKPIRHSFPSLIPVCCHFGLVRTLHWICWFWWPFSFAVKRVQNSSMVLDIIQCSFIVLLKFAV